MSNENSGQELKRMLLLFLIIGGIAFVAINWDSITSPAPTSSGSSNYASNETERQNAVVTCSRGEAERFVEDRVKGFGHLVVGGGFTTLQANDQNCIYVVQGPIIPQGGREVKVVKMEVVKESGGWRANGVETFN